MEKTECFETSAYKIQTPGNYPKSKNTAFITRRNFEIKSKAHVFVPTKGNKDTQEIFKLSDIWR